MRDVFTRWLTGSTIYVKPLPLDNSPWEDDVVLFVENGALGSYEASLDELTKYEAFVQLGGSPVNTDVAIAFFDKDYGASVAASLGLYTLTVTIQDSLSKPLSGAQVAIDGTHTSEWSDTNGIALLRLNNGSYDVIVQPPPGYAIPDSESVTIADADAPLVITLAEDAAVITADDLHAIFGKVNVEKWADLDSNKKQSTINDRISKAISDATEEFKDDFRGEYDLDELVVVRTVKKMIARMAGVDLYQRRGLEDKNEAIENHQKIIKRQTDRLHTRLMKPNATVKGSAIPHVS